MLLAMENTWNSTRSLRSLGRGEDDIPSRGTTQKMTETQRSDNNKQTSNPRSQLTASCTADSARQPIYRVERPNHEDPIHDKLKIFPLSFCSLFILRKE